MNSQLLKSIKRRCTQRKKKLFRSLVRDGFKRVECPQQGNSYLLKDNGGKVLLVAHADTVQQGLAFSRKDGFIHSPMLDDRLGVALVADLLPEILSEPVDILITDDEEISNSSAMSFVSDKEYNWIAEMDRGGGDVVTYDLTSDEWDKALIDAGFEIGQGIYSDICDISLDCCMVNVGIGYEKYHSKDAYAVEETLMANIRRFVMFFDANHDKAFIQDPIKSAPQYEDWLFDDYAGTGVCDFCGIEDELFVAGKSHVCEQCYEYCIYLQEEPTGRCDSCFETHYTKDLERCGLLGSICKPCKSALIEMTN